jgi:hypothetical protein
MVAVSLLIQTRSKIAAIPCPPPMHIVANAMAVRTALTMKISRWDMSETLF